MTWAACPWPVADASRDRALVRSDDLGRLTEDGVRALRAYGVRRVIDLRNRAEADALVLAAAGVPGEVIAVDYG